MIKFTCDKCGHKLGVGDDHAGKRGKCPKCQSVIMVPEKTILINFNCENCGEKISAPATRAGKKGTCPRCKVALVVPAAHDLTLLDMEELEDLKRQQRAEAELAERTDEQDEEIDAESSDEIELVDERKLPWFIDVFLYPLSKPGLIHLAIFIGIPPAITVLQNFVPGVLYVFFSFAGLAVRVLVFLYMYWYLAECIRDSANGWVRAPEGFGSIPELEDMFRQGMNIIGCFGILFGPALLCLLIADGPGLPFWMLSGAALFLYPMALLAAVIFDSPGAIGATLLIRSISVTFRSYCGLVLLFVAVAGLVAAATTMPSRSRLASFALSAACVYAAMITAHLSGRFYWRNQKKLGWKPG